MLYEEESNSDVEEDSDVDQVVVEDDDNMDITFASIGEKPSTSTPIIGLDQSYLYIRISDTLSVAFWRPGMNHMDQPPSLNWTPPPKPKKLTKSSKVTKVKKTTKNKRNMRKK